jgi:hypothetical protein
MTDTLASSNTTAAGAPAQKSMRWPVKRAKAENYLITSVAVFALTVIVTRVYLELTGYPQLGNGVLHIAHALWGGLLLIIAALVPLILANDWALMLSAILSGVGVGLFIDEVGKFITQRNDYFFPPAAPLIYGFFLILLLLLLLVKKSGRDHPRDEMYRALMGLRELVDNNLDAQELTALIERLAVARRSENPQVAGLAEAIQTYLQNGAIPLVPVNPGPWERFSRWTRQIGARLGRRRHRALMIAAMALLGLGTVLAIILLLLVVRAAHSSIPELLNEYLTEHQTASADGGFWFFLRIVLDLLVSLLALASVFLFVAKREHAGVRVAVVALLLQLTGGTLLTFYLNQFSAISTALYQFLVLLVVLAYGRWYLEQPAPHA